MYQLLCNWMKCLMFCKHIPIFTCLKTKVFQINMSFGLGILRAKFQKPS